MAESKAARKERLRKMREKYHLGEYKTSRTRSSAPKRARSERMAKRRKSRSSRSFGGNKFKPLMDASVAGAGVGLLLSVAPQQYNTPVNRAIVGGAAAYFGSGYLREGGKLLLGMEVARVTSKAVAGGLSGITSTASTGSPVVQ